MIHIFGLLDLYFQTQFSVSLLLVLPFFSIFHLPQHCPSVLFMRYGLYTSSRLPYLTLNDNSL